MKAQSSLEFLIMFSLVLLLFIIVILMYFMNVNEAGAIDMKLEATQTCLQVSGAINSIVALGGNSTHTFDLPPESSSNNYTIWVIAENKLIKVHNYGSEQIGIGCRILTSNITNSIGSSFFQLEKNASLKNEFGVLTVEP